MWKSAYNDSASNLEPGDRLGKVVVAVVGDVNDWAAYELEISKDGIANSPEYVATNGDKISEKAARELFPICRFLKWRS